MPKPKLEAVATQKKRTRTPSSGSGSSGRLRGNQGGSAIISTNDNGEMAVSLPGLPQFDINQADSMVPSSNRDSNQITNVLEPNVTDRLTDAERDERLQIYEQGINAEAVKQSGFRYIGEQFKTEQNRVNAIGEFVKVGTSIEKVKGAVADFFTTVEKNREKGANYLTAQMVANRAVASLPEIEGEQEAKLTTAQLKREKAELEMQRLANELAQKREQYGIAEVS
jgi:hypothetical protein